MSKTGFICPKCGWDDSQEYKKEILGIAYITMVCPNCAHVWNYTEEKTETNHEQ